MRPAGVWCAGLVAALSLGACRAGTPSEADAGADPRVAAEQDITLAAGQSVVVTPGALTLTFVRVTSESRCPVHPLISCAWAGTATVALLATSPEGKRTLTIETQPGKDAAPIDRYAVQLVALDPYPRSLDPISAEAYRVTLRLRRR